MKININKVTAYLNKYYLKGLCDRAYIEDSTTLLSTEHNLWSFRIRVKSNETIFGNETPIVIFNTKQFLDLFKLFSGDVDLELLEDKVIFTSEDGQISTEINLGDVEVLDDNYKIFVKEEKLPKEFPIEINATKEFIDKFLSAKVALSEERLFHFKIKRNKPYLIIGNEKNKGNLINIDISDYGKIDEISTEDGKISFVSSYLEKILSVNKDCEIKIKAHERVISVYCVDEKNGMEVQYYWGSNK